MADEILTEDDRHNIMLAIRIAREPREYFRQLKRYEATVVSLRAELEASDAQIEVWQSTAESLDSYIRHGVHNTEMLEKIRLHHHDTLKKALGNP